MSYFDLASILDADLRSVRARHAARLAAEHRRIATARQRAEDAIIVAKREARIDAARAHQRVRALVES